MSATVFGYIALFTLLLAFAAAAAEWGMQGRIAIRRIWTIAIVVALCAPPVALAWHAVAAARVSSDWKATTGTSRGSMLVASARSDIGRMANAARRVAPPSIRVLVPRPRSLRETWTGLSARFSDVSLMLWGLLSLALAAWFAAAVLYWRRACGSWEKATLDGVDVDVSPETGPAVLGILSQRIVLPAWTTTMAPEHRRLLLAHESEHITARDPQRLAIALAALTVMPWNIALWWCVARLRRAIELDCDSRVLRRFPGAKEYGYVLLEVAARSRNSSPLVMPMVGLLRIPTELELRLRAMTRPRSGGARTIAVGGILACVAIGAAFTAPVPAVNARRALAVGRSAARMLEAPARALARRSNSAAASDVAMHSERTLVVPMGENSRATRRGTVHADTIPRYLADSLTMSRRQLDSMRVVLRLLQARTARLVRLQFDLQTTHFNKAMAALLSAERSSADVAAGYRASAAREMALAKSPSLLADTMMTRTAALQAQLRELAESEGGDVASARRATALTAAARSAMTSIQAQIERGMKGMYPEIVAHADSAAVIWFVADSAGRVLRTMYNSGAPGPELSVDSLHARFPDVNPKAIQSITHLDKVLGRSNLSVTWVRLHGDPSQFFKTPK